MFTKCWLLYLEPSGKGSVESLRGLAAATAEDIINDDHKPHLGDRVESRKRRGHSCQP